MKYSQKIILKNGKEALLRNGTAADGAAVLENFNRTHAETDFLLSYPDEKGFTEEQEATFLEEKEKVPTKWKLLPLWTANWPEWPGSTRSAADTKQSTAPNSASALPRSIGA